MTTIDFETTEIPSEIPDGIPFVNENASDDPTCQYPGCNAPLTYSGRGRKPTKCDEHKRASGKKTGTSRGSADVELAVQSLNGLYEGITFPLMAVSPNAAQVWVGQIDGLNERNRMFLATNKDLVRKINSAATKGGTTAFVLSHVMAFAPVVLAVRADFSARAAARAAQEGYDVPQSEASGF